MDYVVGFFVAEMCRHFTARLFF